MSTGAKWGIGAVVAVIALSAYGQLDPASPTTCEGLRAEMLSMTGPNATEPFDAARVRQINEARDAKGCA